jgi:hypothetical protein
MTEEREKELLGEIERLRTALKFYADGHIGVDSKPERHDYRALCPRCRDTGGIARRALEENK